MGLGTLFFEWWRGHFILDLLAARGTRDQSTWADILEVAPLVLVSQAWHTATICTFDEALWALRRQMQLQLLHCLVMVAVTRRPFQVLVT
jgi:hypothetical protein